MNRRAFAILTASALLGCTAPDHIAIAEQAVPKFHGMLNDAKFDALWYQASTELQKASPQSEFVAFLEAIHRKLGKAKSAVKQGWNITYSGTKAYVTLTYRTLYEEGEAGEQFVYRIDGQNAALMGYNITSNALILK